MSLQTSQARIWPKIFAARGDGPGREILPVHRTPSNVSIPYRESAHANAEKTCSLPTVDMYKKRVSERKFSSQKTEKLKHSNVNDEEALAGTIKEINNEIESFQALYNNQWFADKGKGSHTRKQLQQGTNFDEHVNVLKSRDLPYQVDPKSEIYLTQNTLNKSGMRNTTTQGSRLINRDQNNELQMQMSNLSLSQKMVSSSTSRTAYVTNEKQIQKKVDEMTSPGVGPANGTWDLESQDFKTTIDAISTKSTQVGNVGTMSHSNTMQTQTSDVANKELHNEFTARQAEVDEPASVLTEAERQIFKDGITAMNAETEREEKRAAKASSKLIAARRSGSLRVSKEHRKSAEKTPIRPSSSIAKTNMQENNRQPVAVKVVQSQATLYRPQHVRHVSEIRLDKQKKACAEPPVKREMQEKRKAELYHGFLPTRTKSSTSTYSNMKNGNFQAGFVKAVPLEPGKLHVSPSTPLVSKQYATKNMPTKTSQRNLQRGSAQVK